MQSGRTARLRQRGQQIYALLVGVPRLFKPHQRGGNRLPPRVRFVYHDIGGPTRYRVDAQIEQARLAGFVVEQVLLDAGPHLYDLSRCDLLYLHRIVLTPRTRPLLWAARRHGVPIVFDSDDLVWDEQEREYSSFDRRLPPRAVTALLRDIRRTRATMQQADALVFSTPYLAALASATFPQPIYVNANALTRTQIEASSVAYRERLARLDEVTEVVIGYFCGTPYVHDEDVASIGDALSAVLARHPQVRLRLYGEIRLQGLLADMRHASQIQRLPVVPWHELPAHIAGVDIALAPLIDNPQRRAKSAVKYLEAALVGVPLVASRLEPYADDVEHGVTGLLAATPSEWEQSLEALVVDAVLRQQLGAAARERVLAYDTTTARAEAFGHILHRMLQVER